MQGRKWENRKACPASDKSKSASCDHSHNGDCNKPHALRHKALHFKEPLHAQSKTWNYSSYPVFLTFSFLHSFVNDNSKFDNVPTRHVFTHFCDGLDSQSRFGFDTAMLSMLVHLTIRSDTIFGAPSIYLTTFEEELLGPSSSTCTEWSKPHSLRSWESPRAAPLFTPTILRPQRAGRTTPEVVITPAFWIAHL